ncbi:hypothetical protein GCM10023094_51290 [Rhodococcus olei]|uniref:Permease n=1 Tax=Rhodococcus olei TaxID=2161675 RepID=A0ABP8PN88_9NOCA
MTTNDAPAAPRSGMPVWVKRTAWGLLLLVDLVIAYFILAAFLPRWWAQQAGAFASGSMTRGIVWGVGYGFVGTFVPLLLLVVAWRARRWRHARVWVVSAVLLAVLAAAPNLLTLSVVVGTNSAAHAGERILDVDAPGFRGATLAGVIVGALVFGIVAWLVFRYRRRGEQLSTLREQARLREDEDRRRQEGERQSEPQADGQPPV